MHEVKRETVDAILVDDTDEETDEIDKYLRESGKSFKDEEGGAGGMCLT